jgi:hypothetical protein
MTGAEGLLDEIALLGYAEGKQGVRGQPVVFTYVRDLGPEDIDILRNVAVGSKSSTVQKLRYSHHLLARLVAGGKSPAEIASITGHATSTIHRLQTQDPAFGELVAHYAKEREAQFLDAAGRLAIVGATAVEILQERLEDKPESFKNRELLEVAEMAFDRSVAPSKGLARGQQGAGGVTVNVSFVSPQSDAPPLIDVTAAPALCAPSGTEDTTR